MSKIFSLRKPTDDQIRRALDAQRDAPFTYPDVGAIEGEFPQSYLRNGVRVRLGAGQLVYEAAVAALRTWKQFEVGWVELCWPTTTPAPGALVGVLAQVCGVWALSISRIIAVIDETGPRRRFAVIYGTLPQHAETGEERFQIEWDQSDDTVWYEVRAFYRPHHPLVRWTWPLVGRIPRNFVRESAAAIQRALPTETQCGSARSPTKRPVAAD